MTSSDAWKPAGASAALPDGARLAVTVEGQPLLLIRQGETVYALYNRCSHLGCALTRGQIEGGLITCPCHDWTFDIRTGEFTQAREIVLPTFPARIAADLILVQL